MPARAEQFAPRVEGDRLYGRGAYDMKGGLAAMMGAVQELQHQSDVRVVFVVVPDEESEEESDRATDFLVKQGYTPRLRHHRRADGPPHRRAGEGGAGDADRGVRHGRARRDAVAG